VPFQEEYHNTENCTGNEPDSQALIDGPAGNSPRICNNLQKDWGGAIRGEILQGGIGNWGEN
jgi:hypothetical protein